MTDLDVIDAEIVRTADEWADVIKGNLGRAVGEIVAAGQNLIAAKADLAHGEWLPMLAQIGISQPHAHKLMRIGGELANHSNSNDLPSSIEALYTLSALDSATINAGIERGDIHPGMTIKDAKGYAQEITDRATGNVNTETGEIAEPTTRDRATEKTEREVSIVNDLRLYLRHIGTDKAITGMSTGAKRLVIEALEEAATNLKESL